MILKPYCFIDDSVSGVGGTMLTLDAITEFHKDEIDFISTSEFSLSDSFKNYKVFILGNVMNLTQNSKDAIFCMMQNKNFVKIEFDYGYCAYRGTIPHKVLANESCSCPFGETGDKNIKELYSLIKQNCSHIFYMSEKQMKIHQDHISYSRKMAKAVLSSCFSSDNLSLFQKLKSKSKNNKFAIIDGNGGWHSQAKGVGESIAHAKSNNLDFDLIKTEKHLDMLNLLSQYSGLISMPIIHDTCPRITIESRFMNLEVITNDNSQHITESWWKKTDQQAFDYIKSRPKFFWNQIEKLRNGFSS